MIIYSLFTLTNLGSTIAVPKSKAIQPERSDGAQHGIPQYSEISKPNLGTISPVDHRKRDFNAYGGDDHEALVAFCEAGFVSDCRQAIAKERAAAGSSAKSLEPPLTSFRESILDMGFTKTYEGKESPPCLVSFLGGFILICVAVAFIVAVTRGHQKYSASSTHVPAMKQRTCSSNIRFNPTSLKNEEEEQRFQG